MSVSSQEPQRRVLIASANPLFAKGLQKLVTQHWGGRNMEIRMANSMEEATAILEAWQPHLVIVDYDDRTILRGAFLTHFIAEDRPMQVMLVSLRESGEVVVYDRRTLTTAQAEDWFDLPWLPIAEPGSPEMGESTNNVPAGAVQPAGVSETHSSPRSKGMRNEDLRSGGLKRFIVPGVLTIIVTVIMTFVLRNIGLLPTNASTQFTIMSGLVDLQLWFIAFLFSLITVFVVYSAIVFRHKPGDSGMGANFKQSNQLEVFWTIIPLGLVIFLSFLGSRGLAAERVADPNALEVKVTAFQWGWLFEYPKNGNVQSNQLYLPVDRQVHLVMTSRDVIHSFWVPEFGVKQDILPGENLVKELRINPTRTGSYTVMCNQLCGGAHAYMTAPVRVVSAQEFDNWVASKSNTANQTPAQRGQALAQNNGCLACHSINGTKGIGPTWKGLAGEQVKLADGTTTTADDAYLHTAVVEPNKQIAAGFPPSVMPQTYKNSLNDQQIQDIIAYIKTLK